MKKLLILTVTAVMLSTPLGASADISAVYDSGTKAISVRGTVSSEVEAVSIHLAAINEENTVSDENVPLVSALAIVNSGVVAKDVFVNLPQGKYNVFFGTDANAAKRQTLVIYDPKSPESVDAIAKVNTANESAMRSYATNTDFMISLGIDAEGDSLAADNMATVLAIKDGTYTAESFVNAYLYAKAANTMLQNKDVDAVMQTNASLFNCTYEQYQAVKANSAIDNAFLRGGIIKQRLTLDELSVIGQAIGSKSRGDLETVFTDNATEIGIDLNGSYKSIPAMSRYKVFAELFNHLDVISTYDEIVTAFDAAVDRVIRDLNNGGSSSGSVGGGGSSGKSSSAAVQSPYSVAEPVETKPLFSDISNHWAKDDITALCEKGILSGYSDNTFQPDGNITRAELCKILAVGFSLSSSGSAAFSDVSANAWYFDAVSALSENKIVFGSDGSFRPDAFVTRQDSAVMIQRLVSYLGTDLNGSYSFSDADAISDYAKEAVCALAANGYLKGDGVGFHPQSPITRAETASLIYRIYNQYGGENR